MRIVIAVAAALSIFIAAEAPAQNAMSPAPFKSSSPTTAPKAGTGAAPVGHRQPTQAEVGKADADLNASAEDKELDRKIKSICKGC